MQLGIFTRVFEGRFEDVLYQIRSHGLTHIQFNFRSAGLSSLPAHIEDDQIKKIGRQIKSNQLQLAAISGTFNMIHPDPREVERGIQSFRCIAHASSLLNNPMITLCTGSRDPLDKWKYHPGNTYAEAWSDMCSIMEKLLPIAEEADVLLGIEPEVGNVVSDAEKGKRLLGEMQSNRLRVVFDPANLIRAGSAQVANQTIASSLELLAGHIEIVHAKDRKADDMVCRPGKGLVDFSHLAAVLRRLNVDPLVLIHDIRPDEVAVSTRFLRQAFEAG